VITGVSGSGKSSLAMDTLFAEGQRRYMESLSTYARQFVGQMDKPDVEAIEGLSPAIAIDQRAIGRSPRSTVGTITEIYDFLRILFARVGRPHCPQCGAAIQGVTFIEMRDRLLELPPGTRLWILSPVVRGQPGSHRRILEGLAREGFLRVRVDGEIRELTERISLAPKRPHTIEVVVDRIALREGISSRLVDSLETAARLSEGLIRVEIQGGDSYWFSEHPYCPVCDHPAARLHPKLFSFNDPQGACPVCKGLGHEQRIDPAKIVSDPARGLGRGSHLPWVLHYAIQPLEQALKEVARSLDFDLSTPFRDLPAWIQRTLLYGPDPSTKKKGNNLSLSIGWWEGIIPSLERLYRQSDDPTVREAVEELMGAQPCHGCKGLRLRPEALAVRVGGKGIGEMVSIPLTKLRELLVDLPLRGEDQHIAREILEAIIRRLDAACALGIGYLTLGRGSETLSAGEAQRIRLASQTGTDLVGLLYILDEPTVGLHPKDQRALLDHLRALRDSGNTLVVVEHDADLILSADHAVDMGPGAGEEGGHLLYSGPPQGLLRCEDSLTGAYLSGKRRIPVPEKRRRGSGQYLELIGARLHNLKGIHVRFPLGCFICVTGVSGSGKSSLVVDTLYGAVRSHLRKEGTKSQALDEIRGLPLVDRVLHVDQAPIGRSPRSNPATFTGVFAHIRDLFARLPEARLRGYRASRFSFNVKGGRCESCQGEGKRRIEMLFLPDAYATCASCRGTRYNDETLQIRYKGLNVAQVLELTIREALAFFENVPQIQRPLDTLVSVGLGYLRLGQPADTLSGGEAQRLKLAKELGRRQSGRTLYILDEPTSGLHPEDIRRLLEVLQRLVDAGNTVIVIEHNMDVVKCADYIIELGPGAGDDGGWLVACGTPEEVARHLHCPTAPFLRKALEERSFT